MINRSFLLSMLFLTCSLILSAQPVGWLKIKSEIEAEVYVDGKFISVAPSTIALEPGDHNVVVSNKMYCDFEQSIAIVPDSLSILDVSLVKKYSDVYINIPKNTKVYLDSNLITESDSPISLTYGEHVFRISARGCYDKEVVVNVSADTKSIDLPTPYELKGYLHVCSNVDDVCFYIDGKQYYGEVVCELKAGDYYVSATASGYKTEEKIITIKSYQTTDARFDLEPVSEVKVETNVDDAFIFVDGEIVYENPFELRPGKYTIKAMNRSGKYARKNVNVAEGLNSYKLTIPYWSFSDLDIHLGLGYQALPYSSFTMNLGWNLFNVNTDFDVSIGGWPKVIYSAEYLKPTYTFDYAMGYAIIIRERLRVTPQAALLVGGYKTTEDMAKDYNSSSVYMGGDFGVKFEYALLKHIAITASGYYRYIDEADLMDYLGGMNLKFGLVFYWGV